MEIYHCNTEGVLNANFSHIHLFAVHGYQLFKQSYKLCAIARR